jgi:hypothetical protein
MTKRTLMSLAAVVALLVLLPGAAQLQDQAASKRACHPEGTWFGANTFGHTFVIRFVSEGGGRYSAVADGWNIAYPAPEKTSFHGELVRTGPRSFWVRQIALFEDYPMPGFPEGLFLAGSEGEVTMTGASCDHFEVAFNNVGAYFWEPFGPLVDPDFVWPVPFVDEFDIRFPSGLAWYDRMPEY